MAAHKYSYIIFNNCKNITDLNLTLNNAPIARCKSTTFLGVVLDEKLHFYDHVNKILIATRSRINIIKILSHISWLLSNRTLPQLYSSLFRSIFDYIAILAPAFSCSRLTTLQTLQNTALCSILALPKSTEIYTLHQPSNTPMLVDRKDLARRYFVNAVLLSNPIIISSFLEFQAFANGRILHIPTLFTDTLLHSSMPQ